MATKKVTKKALESKVKALEAKIEALQQENNQLKAKVAWYENLSTQACNALNGGFQWLTGQLNKPVDKI